MRVVLVGVCGSGKSVLARGLRRLGFEVRECGQEHSEVPHMWQVISRPDVLVYLQASEEATLRRGQRHYVPGFVEIERRRLAHARQHCDLCVDTDDLSEAEVLERVRRFLLQVSASSAKTQDSRLHL
jgi:RNase adaptor protein for sRNA GlmZ degradation